MTYHQVNQQRPFVIRLLLHRVLWLLPIICWAAVIVWSLLHNLETIERHHTSIAADSTRNIFRVIKLTRQWNAEHGGVYVPITEQTQPNPYLTIPERDIKSVDGRQFTMINPAFMTRQLSELIPTESGVTFHITSLRPIRPANQPDPWEREVLKRFEQGETEFYQRVPRSNGERSFRYMAPLRVEPACLRCHASQGYQVGDIRGGISVTLNDTGFFQSEQQEAHKEVVKHIAIFCLVVALLLLFMEMLRRQWLTIERVKQSQQQEIELRTQELQHLASHDTLTQLYNRQGLDQKMREECDRAQRYHHPLSVFMLDLDHFKRINDNYSHQFGDVVLQRFAQVVEGEIRKTDTAARFGGEEFVIILPETDQREAEEMAQRLLTAVARMPIETEQGGFIHITTSIGIACLNGSIATPEELLSRADEALYRAKDQGRNRAVTAH